MDHNAYIFSIRRLFSLRIIAHTHLVEQHILISSTNFDLAVVSRARKAYLSGNCVNNMLGQPLTLG
jgi:hypothetical protein